jgi:prohibitin 2
VIIVLLPRMVVTVESGQVGVLWKRFGEGTVLDPRELRDEGIHLIMPWDKLFIYNLRIQSLSETYNAISSDGVNMNATINTRFRLQRDSVPALHQVVGPDYAKVLGPQIASDMREIIAQYTAEEVYSTARQQIQDKIRERALEKLSHKMIERESVDQSYNVAMRDTVILYDTLLYGIELPATVTEAINRKAEQYYIAEEYRFRIEREKKESDRKRIEAEGIRDFQHIIGSGISDSYLRWRGIEATLQLAQSKNSKLVIIGGGKDGLPIILGNADATPASHPATEDGATSKPKASAGESTIPLEKTPASNLTTPREKTATESEKPSEESSPSFVQSLSVRSVVPLSLLDLASHYLRLLRSSEVGPDPAKPAAPTATAQPQ